VLSIPSSWSESELKSLRYRLDLNDIYVGVSGRQQRKIIRRNTKSWSFERYKPEDGPFTDPNVRDVILTPASTSGMTTLSSDRPVFKPKHVGALFRLTHGSQNVYANFTGANQESDEIRITGVGAGRSWDLSITGTWVGTITLEQAIGSPSGWTTYATYVTNTTPTISDSLDNQIVYYRAVIKSGDYTSGSPVVHLGYEGGVTVGIARVLGFTSPSQVDVEVLKSFGDVNGTVDWRIGMWSDEKGWPRSIDIFDGRLWYELGGKAFGSVSDEYHSFDQDVEGDSAPVIRSLGFKSGDGAQWLLGLQRLIAGSLLSEVSVRSSSFDGVITPTDFVPRDASTFGCADVQPVKIDASGIFTHRNGYGVCEISYDNSEGGSDYGTREITLKHPDICAPGIKSIYVQRKPYTRVFFLLTNGEVRALTYDKVEKVDAWSRVKTKGLVESMCIRPGVGEDIVTAYIIRQINGVDVRFYERLAMVSETVGGEINKMADSFIEFDLGSGSTTIPVPHLEGEQVIVWADGVAVADQDSMVVVQGGNAEVPVVVKKGIVGLAYTGHWTSTKLGYGSEMGTALNQRKRPNHLSFNMIDTAPDGVRMGSDDGKLTRIADSYKGRPLSPSQVIKNWDTDGESFKGDWDTDPRIHIDMRAPYPCHIATMTLSMVTHDRG